MPVAAATTAVLPMKTNLWFNEFFLIFHLIWNCARSTIRSGVICVCRRRIGFVGVDLNGVSDCRSPGGVAASDQRARFGTGNPAHGPGGRVFRLPVDSARRR